MIFEPLPLRGCWRIRTQPARDDRGAFARLFDVDAFRAAGLETTFEQRSISTNRARGVLRGLHYQAEPFGEVKLIRCSRGAAFDVLVDVRGGPGFGRWHAEPLSEGSETLLYVPKGIAHGFQTLMDDTELEYAITPAYRPEAARAVRWDDPDLAIPWPLPAPVLSERDRASPCLRNIPPEPDQSPTTA